MLPGYDGRNRTYFFGVPGSGRFLELTQVLSVPTLAERQDRHPRVSQAKRSSFR